MNKKKTISLEDAQMYLMLKALMDDENFLRKYIGIRKLERDLTKNMKVFGGNHIITLSDFTRWMMKKEPKILGKIDKVIEENIKD